MQNDEQIAKMMHDQSDGDGCDVPWGKQLPRYRSQQRRQVRKVLSALTAAGYRILGPDELDPVTVDRCAAIAIEQANADLGLKLLAREDKDGHGAMIHAAEEGAARSIAISFRALIPEAPQPEAKEARDA